MPWINSLRHAHPAVPNIMAPEDAITFNNYRWAHIDRDLPNLRTTPVAAGVHQIAQGLNTLVTEQCLQQQADKTRRTRERNKTPQEYFGTGLRKLMRWCQVLDEADLPPLYSELALAKRGRTGWFFNRPWQTPRRMQTWPT